MDAELDAAIGSLYRVFAPYPLRPSTEPCLHCHSPDVETGLHAHPLRELSADDLREFAAEALFVWGTVVDYKHFLPRILEIAVAEGGFDWPDLESVFHRLSYAEWRRWPDDEQEAVESFLRAAWPWALALYPVPVDDIGAFLGAIAVTGLDLDPFLDIWLEAPGEEPLRHLADFVHMDLTLVWTKGRLSDAVSRSTQKEAADAVRRWVLSGRPRQRLVDGFFGSSTDAIGAAVSDAVSVLEALGGDVRPDDSGGAASSDT